jgi:putative ABC transport system substrate-binding protein
MYMTEQGVLHQSKLIHLLVHILLSLTFCLTQPASAETLAENTASHKKNKQKHHVFIIYSPDNTLHANIIQKLSENLKLKRPDIILSEVTPEEIIKTIDSNNDLIIGIGYAGMRSADKHYPKTKKLFISTDPNKYRLDKNKNKNKNDAILYMAQPYCRQIPFIKLLNGQWKTIGLLNSREKPIDTNTIQQCAKKHGLDTYIVNTTSNEYLKDHIKDVLNHSDILLALPDKNIFNSQSVKNILLTSYRHRKPVIAFSRNFVDAGALASIYSSTEQIAQSASKLVGQYFKSGQQFKKSVNYPQAFDVSINRQVFRALDLSIPDLDELKQTLKHSETEKAGKLQ